jgi:peroxiredoxin
MHPPIGTLAPDFELSSQYGERIRLSDLRGSPVALVFFPLAFSGTCTSELCELRDNVGLFAASGVQLVGISVDSKASLRAWAERERSGFPLLADFWPHGEVARSYGVFNDEAGFANRGTFVIDREGVVRFAEMTGPGESRDQKPWREVLAGLV